MTGRYTLTTDQLEQLHRQRHDQGLPPRVTDEHTLMSAAALLTDAETTRT